MKEVTKAIQTDSIVILRGTKLEKKCRELLGEESNPNNEEISSITSPESEKEV